MRTITENKNSLYDIRIRGTVPFLCAEEGGSESCFYELGDARSAIYGAYVDRSMPSIIKRIEKVCCG